MPGWPRALAVVRRHRLIETWLVQELGYGWDEVHDEAEVLEHAISDRLLEAIDARLGRPARDPHGDAIPSAAGTLERATPCCSPSAAPGHAGARRAHQRPRPRGAARARRRGHRPRHGAHGHGCRARHPSASPSHEQPRTPLPRAAAESIWVTA